MSQTGVVAWSKTAASNSTADSNVNWAEGMAPSAVNDSARAEMASVAKYRDDTAGTLTTGGTSTAYTLTTNQVFSALTVLNGQELSVKFNATNGASPTLNVDGLGAKAINVDTATAVGTGVIKANSIWNVVYDNSNTCFILKAVPAQVQDGTVATASIAANAVTLAKMATQADSTVLGNISGSSAVPSALTLSGFALSGSTITAPHPPNAAFSNLSIKVTGNTGVTLAADYITVTNGSGGWQTLAFSQAINMASTGAGALDTGAIASATWYAIWAIAKADGTTSAIASTSTTAPTMPSGYTYKARVGWLRTRVDLAQLLGTWQLGRRARYIVGLGALAHSYVMSSGAVGTYDAVSPTLSAISVSNFAPTTASIISCTVASTFTGAANSNLILAPSTAYSGTNNGPNGSSGNIPTFFGSITTIGLNSTVDVFLESTNVYWCSSAAGGALLAAGWEDNI